MPRIAKAENVVTMYTDREAALIARALHEAAERHLKGYDPEFHEDKDIGREMLRLMKGRFPDALEAFDRAETLRKALALNFLPPQGVDQVAAAKAFLEAHKAAETAKAARSKATVPTYQPDDSDIPF